nr:MAG TPA: Neuralized [Caudoviricetes sp.]
MKSPCKPGSNAGNPAACVPMDVPIWAFFDPLKTQNP